VRKNDEGKMLVQKAAPQDPGMLKTGALVRGGHLEGKRVGQQHQVRDREKGPVKRVRGGSASSREKSQATFGKR